MPPIMFLRFFVVELLFSLTTHSGWDGSRTHKITKLSTSTSPLCQFAYPAIQWIVKESNLVGTHPTFIMPSDLQSDVRNTILVKYTEERRWDSNPHNPGPSSCDSLAIEANFSFKGNALHLCKRRARESNSHRVLNRP